VGVDAETRQTADKEHDTDMRKVSLFIAIALTAFLLPVAPAGANSLEAPGPGVLEDFLPEPVLGLEGRPRYVLLVEKDRQLLHLLRYDGQVELVRTMPCTTGQNLGDKSVVGDKKTPEGVYFFTRHIDGDELPPLYGAGAFPMDYPNFFDRKDGRKGSGIWLHGVEYEGRVLKARDTRGCVAVGNDDFRDLEEMIELRDTPIVVTTSFRWLQREDHERLEREVRDALEGWHRAWEGKQIDTFIDHYDEGFRSRGMNRDAWKAYKDRFNKIYAHIDVEMEDLALLQEGEGRVIADFRQKYASDRYRDEGHKQLYLRRTDEGWKIWGERWKPLEIERLETPPAAVTAAPAPAPMAAVVPPAAPRLALRMEDLALEPGEGFVKVSFRLQVEDGEPASGYLSLAARDERGRGVGHYPKFNVQKNGRPADYRRGQWFFAPGERHIDAVVPVTGEAAELRIQAWGRDGTLLLDEEIAR
jgi:murein L,D-transpeptidase YafK